MSTNSKTYEVFQFILDSVVPEINVPIMKPGRKKHSIWKNGSIKLSPKYRIKLNKKVCK